MASLLFTPEFVEEPSCIVFVNDINITIYRCSYYGEEDVLIHIIRNNFTDFYNASDGGAVLLYDSGFECNNVSFTECISMNGGGGAIYIKNSRTLKYNITFNNTCFTRSYAAYGSACYIYSSSNSNDVLFKIVLSSLMKSIRTIKMVCLEEFHFS